MYFNDFNLNIDSINCENSREILYSFMSRDHQNLNKSIKEHLLFLYNNWFQNHNHLNSEFFINRLQNLWKFIYKNKFPHLFLFKFNSLWKHLYTFRDQELDFDPQWLINYTISQLPIVQSCIDSLLQVKYYFFHHFYKKHYQSH